MQKRFSYLLLLSIKFWKIPQESKSIILGHHIDWLCNAAQQEFQRPGTARKAGQLFLCTERILKPNLALLIIREHPHKYVLSILAIQPIWLKLYQGVRRIFQQPVLQIPVYLQIHQITQSIYPGWFDSLSCENKEYYFFFR